MPLLDLASSSTEDDGSQAGQPDESSESEHASDSDRSMHKRQRQTEKARTKRLVNRIKSSRISGKEHDPRRSRFEDWANRLQDMYFTPNLYTAVNQTKEDAFAAGNYQKVARERARAVKSLMVQVLWTLRRILAPPQDSSLQCVLDCVVLDDTSTCLRNPGDFTSTIYTVMNTVQAVHIQYSNGQCNSFAVPTPFMVLQSQKTEDLHTAYTSQLLLSSMGLVQAVKAVEMALQHPAEGSVEQLLQTASSTWKCQVMVGDALPTNDAVFKYERDLLAAAGTAQQSRRLCLRMKCQLHQLCLVRKPAVLSVEKFWSTLVRLAHLFEQNSFKRQFALALVQVLKAPGAFQRA